MADGIAIQRQMGSTGGCVDLRYVKYVNGVNKGETLTILINLAGKV